MKKNKYRSLILFLKKDIDTKVSKKNNNTMLRSFTKITRQTSVRLQRLLYSTSIPTSQPQLTMQEEIEKLERSPEGELSLFSFDLGEEDVIVERSDMLNRDSKHNFHAILSSQHKHSPKHVTA